MSEYIEHDKDSISVGIVEKKQFTFAEPPDELLLDSGAKLGPVALAYETYGSLNEDRSNVVLILPKDVKRWFLDLKATCELM